MKTPKEKIKEMERIRDMCLNSTRKLYLTEKIEVYKEGYENGKNEVDEDKVEAHTQVTLNAILQERNRIRALIVKMRIQRKLTIVGGKIAKLDYIDYKEILKELEEKQDEK